MADLFTKVEVDDRNSANLILDEELRGLQLTLRRFNQNSLKYFIRNLGDIKQDIVFGNNIRVYADYGTNPPTTKVFTGTNTDFDAAGTYDETLGVYARDLFQDRKASKDINKKYADQEVATTVKDIINNFMGGGFTVTAVDDLGISQPYNFVSENVGNALARITKSSFSELFMKPDKDVVLRSLQTVDIGVTITDSNIRHPRKVKIRKGISDSYGIVRVVGGKSTQAYDLNKRVIAEERVPNAAANIKDRVFNIVDERFTTWEGAKTRAVTVANDVGEEVFAFDTPLFVHNLTKLPMAGDLININSTELGITNTRFIVEEIGITHRAGLDAVKFISLRIGSTEQEEYETLQLLQEIFESEKRKALDADSDTNQKFFSIPIAFDPIITVTITTRNTSMTPYKWADSVTAKKSKYSFAKWGSVE